MPKVKRVVTSRRVRYGKTPLIFRNPFRSTGAVLPDIKVSYNSLENGVNSVEEAEKNRQQQLDEARQRAGIFTEKEKSQLMEYKAAKLRQMIELYDKMARDLSLSEEERQQFGALSYAQRKKLTDVTKKYYDSVNPALKAFNALPEDERRKFMMQYDQARINEIRNLVTVTVKNDAEAGQLLRRIKNAAQTTDPKLLEWLLDALAVDEQIKRGARRSATSASGGYNGAMKDLLLRYAGQPSGHGSFGDAFRAPYLFQTLEPAIGFQRGVKTPKDWRKQQEDHLQQRQEFYKKAREALYGVTPTTHETNSAMPKTAEPISLSFMRL